MDRYLVNRHRLEGSLVQRGLWWKARWRILSVGWNSRINFFSLPSFLQTLLAPLEATAAATFAFDENAFAALSFTAGTGRAVGVIDITKITFDLTNPTVQACHVVPLIFRLLMWWSIWG